MKFQWPLLFDRLWNWNPEIITQKWRHLESNDHPIDKDIVTGYKHVATLTMDIKAVYYKTKLTLIQKLTFDEI